MINLAIFAAAIVVFLAVYWLVHSKFNFTNLGRIASAAILALGTLLDQAQALPWPSILDTAKAEMVAFGIAAGMGLVHAWKLLQDALNPPATPPAA